MNTAGERFRADIEGLRAVAVGAVVLYHAHVPHFRGGYVGVDVFFVISGFLITGLLMRDDSSSPLARLRHFYARRVRRIVPAATLVVIGTLIGAAVLANPLAQRTARTDATAAMLFFSNIRFERLATDYFQQDRALSLFQHFWSLSVEEQFYLVWPALVVAVGLVAVARRRAALIATVAIVGTVSLALCVRLTETNPAFAFFLLPTRAWELCAGAGLALGAARIRMPVALSSLVRACGLASIAVAITQLDDGTKFPGAAALWPVVGAALVILAGTPSAEHEGHVLTPRPMQLLGRYSYSLYLWHWPVLLLVSLRRPSVFTDWHEALVVMALLALPGAVASFHLVEHPFRREFTSRPDGQSLLAGVALVAVFGAVLVPYNAAAASGLDSGDRVIPTAVTPAHATDFVPTNLEPPLQTPGFIPSGLVGCRRLALGCVTGDPAASRSIVLFGDSHANHWVFTFGLFGKQQGWRVEVIGSPGCRSFVEPPSRFGQNCDGFRAAANARIAALRPALVVFSNQSAEFFGRDRTGWATGVGEALDALPAGVRAAVFSQTPRAARRVPECLADHVADTRACEPARAPIDTMNTALRAVAADHSAAFLDLTPWFCTAKRCPVVMSDVLVYRDRSHVTAAFTATRVDALAAAVRAAVA